MPIDVYFLLSSSAAFLFLLLFVHFYSRSRFLQRTLSEKEQQCSGMQESLQTASQQLACKEMELQKEREAFQEKLRLLESSKEALTHQFKSLSQDVLKSNSESFLQLAKSQFDLHQKQSSHVMESKQKEMDQMMRPIGEVLKQFDISLKEMEKSRQTAYVSLHEQVKHMQVSQEKVCLEAQNLSKALRVPNTRGKWGEVQLRKVVELAGMVETCDFEEQAKGQNDDGALRPDLVVRLPGNRSVVVDAKTPLKAYLDAFDEENDEKAEAFMKEHARSIKAHIQALSAKSYWKQFSPSPEFVVLFLPAESFFSQALRYEPDLIEYAAKNHVIMATPTTLIALLRTIAYGWHQDAVEKNAQQITELALELSERFKKFLSHFEALRKNLNASTQSYNQALNSFETRLLPSFRKFQAVVKKKEEEIETPKTIESAAKELSNGVVL